MMLKPSPNHKLKAFANSKSNLADKKKKIVLGRVVDMVEKGENAGYQHFLLFHVFKRHLF